VTFRTDAICILFEGVCMLVLLKHTNFQKQHPNFSSLPSSRLVMQKYGESLQPYVVVPQKSRALP